MSRPAAPAPLLLYSTDGCHLCEQALQMLLGIPELVGRELEVLDIAADDALVTRYGELIPVLAVAGVELHWPFGPAEVLDAAART